MIAALLLFFMFLYRRKQPTTYLDIQHSENEASYVVIERQCFTGYALSRTDVPYSAIAKHGGKN